MDDETLATVYAFAFHDPKPLHTLVLRNWGQAKFLHLIILTDRKDAWASVLPDDAKHIEIVQKGIEDVFASTYPFFGATDNDDFASKFGWLFNPTHFQINGYLGCQLRPLLNIIEPRSSRKFWGWIDNDTFLNCAELRSHLLTCSADMALFPRAGYMWEQFKLFSSRIDTEFMYREMINYHLFTREPTQAPLEAKFIYHMKDSQRFSVDGLSQEQIAVHWAYTDKDVGIPNQYSVFIFQNMSMKGKSGQTPLFFNADTQLKIFTESEAAEVQAALDQAGFYLFRFIPRLN